MKKNVLKMTILALVTLIAIGFFVWPNSQPETVNLPTAKRLYESRKFKEARQIYTALAATGDAEAQYQLGRMHDRGEGGKKNAHLATDYYRQAAEQNHVIAQYCLGYNYSHGEGVQQDKQQAEYWYLKAAEQGYASAQHNLGYLHQYGGPDFSIDTDKARYWYRQAMAQNHVNSMHGLALLLCRDCRSIAELEESWTLANRPEVMAKEEIRGLRNYVMPFLSIARLVPKFEHYLRLHKAIIKGTTDSKQHYEHLLSLAGDNPELRSWALEKALLSKSVFDREGAARKLLDSVDQSVHAAFLAYRIYDGRQYNLDLDIFPIDADKSEKFLKQAAEQGHLIARENLKEQMPRSIATGLRLLVVACIIGLLLFLLPTLRRFVWERPVVSAMTLLTFAYGSGLIQFIRGIFLHKLAMMFHDPAIIIPAVILRFCFLALLFYHRQVFWQALQKGGSFFGFFKELFLGFRASLQNSRALGITLPVLGLAVGIFLHTALVMTMILVSLALR